MLTQREDGKYIPVRDNPRNQRNFQGKIIGNLQQLKDKYFGNTRVDFMKNKRDFENKVKQTQENIR